jgi:hypothetical protein
MINTTGAIDWARTGRDTKVQKCKISVGKSDYKKKSLIQRHARYSSSPRRFLRITEHSYYKKKDKLIEIG